MNHPRPVLPDTTNPDNGHQTDTGQASKHPDLRPPLPTTQLDEDDRVGTIRYGITFSGIMLSEHTQTTGRPAGYLDWDVRCSTSRAVDCSRSDNRINVR